MSQTIRDCGLLGLVCCLCYVNFASGAFHYDDFHSLVQNPHIRTLANIPDFFTEPATFSADVEKKMYRPVLLLSYAVQYAVHGYEPLGFLLANLLIHIVASILVCALAGDLLGSRRAGLVAALFFAAHPIAGEPVNYISSRSESLAACFYLATLLLAVQGRRNGALLCYSVGLLVKSVLITAPVLLWIIDGWLRRGQRSWRYFMPYAGVAVGYVGLISYNRFLSGSLAAPVRDWMTQLLTQCKTPAYYLHLLAMPSNLNVEHQFFAAKAPDAAVVVGFALLASLGWLAWVGRGRFPGAMLLCGAVLLLPTTIMPLNMLVNERRLYLVLACLALGAGYLSNRLSRRWQFVWLLCAVGLCLQRNPVWQSELTLWQDATKKAPLMYRTQANLGKALQLAGRPGEARAAYLRAIDLDDRQADPYNNIATLYHLEGDVIEAIAWYEQAIDRNPQLNEVHQNLGDAYAQQGAPDKAIAAYKRALAIDGEKGEVWSNYGLILYREGHLNAAAAAFQMAIERLPGQAEPYNNLANIYVDRREYGAAENLYKEALQKTSEQNGQILANLGDLYRVLGRYAEGRARLGEAMGLQPANADWQFRLGRLEREAGREDMARKALLRAVELDPGHIRARVQLAEIYGDAGAWNEAVGEYRMVLLEQRDYSRAWYGLAGALDALGDVDGALAAYGEFLAGWTKQDRRASEARDRMRVLQGGS